MSTKTLLRLIPYLLVLPLTATACSGGGANIVQASQPPVAASASAQPDPSGAPSASVEEPDTVPMLALGNPIAVHTMGNNVPLAYTVTLSNLRTGLASGNTVKPTKGQFIMVDVKFHADKGRFVSGSPAMFKLVLPDDTLLDANIAASPDRAMPGVKTVWIKSLEQGESFAAQLLFDAPLNLAGCKIAVVEITGMKGVWNLT